MKSHYLLLGLVLLVGSLEAKLNAQTFNLSITTGSSTYNQASTPTTEGSTTFTSNFSATTPTLADNLFQNWWFYRVAGDTRERPFGNYTKTGGGAVTMTGSAAANVMTFNLTETDAAAVTRFTSVLTFTITNVANGTQVAQRLVVTNPGATPLSLSFFNYADYDVPTASSNTATGGLGGITVTNTAATQFGQHTPLTPANAFQVMPFSTLRGLLADTAVNNLSNSGLPFAAGDYTGAFQWDLTIAAGDSAIIDVALSNLNSLAVPEPGTIALMGMTGISSLIAFRFLRRKRALRFARKM
jgi:hypothetical protein